MGEHSGLGAEDLRIINSQKRAKLKNFKEYHLMVDTSTRPTASTRGDVFIQLFGNRGKTGLIHLNKGFQTMTRSEFALFAADVGRVEKIRLAVDSTERWLCDRVWLMGPEGAREFPVGTSIGWPNNPEM